MKKRLTKIAEENNVQFTDLLKLSDEKLSPSMVTGAGRKYAQGWSQPGDF